MSFEVKKQGRETTQALIRRFTTRIRQSGILKRARKVRFWARPKSHSAKKKTALRKEELRLEYATLKKMGKLKEPVRPSFR